MERNLDTDLDFLDLSPSGRKGKPDKSKADKTAGGKRRHSLAATLNFLHLN